MQTGIARFPPIPAVRRNCREGQLRILTPVTPNTPGNPGSVEIARDLGAHHRLIVRDQGIDEPQEDRRVLRRGAAGLGGVGTIIAAGADDLVRVGDRRQQSDLRQRDIRRPALYLGCGGA